MRRLLKGLVFGLTLGLFGALLAQSPWGLALEEEFALGWLFRLRGPLPVPDEVVVVSMDRASQKRLGLQRKYAKWPRRLHARLIERLAGAGAVFIAFDTFFAEPRDPEDDRLLADAIARAGNVLLVQRIEKEVETLQAGAPVEIRMEVVRDPSAPFAAAALEMAPFVLPTVPLKVTQFWTFKPEAGDAPTLPVAAFQLYALEYYGDLHALLLRLDPQGFAWLPATRTELIADSGLVAFIRRLRGVFQSRPGLLQGVRDGCAHLSPARRRALISLAEMYAGGHSRYLKYYGPPLSFAPIPFYRILEMPEGELERLRGKVVFVGVSAAAHWEQEDIFSTPYPTSEGDFYISGVEVAATAFGNLLHNGAVRPLTPSSLLIMHLVWGLLVGMLTRRLPAGRAAPAILLLSLAYAIATYWAFATRDLWLPLVVPLFVQALPALFIGIWLGYREASRSRARIYNALNRYLPEDAASELAGDISRGGLHGQVLQGVCMATDAEQYTALAERLSPQVLSGLLNDYYEVVFKPIKTAHGFVSDVVGDAALGLWLNAREEDSRLTRQRSCEAALDILDAVRTFNRDRPRYPLPIRIGLHFGEVYVGDVGAGHHFEYRAVGDIVNTAARIEQACKKLGCRLLVSREVLEQVEGFISRDLGEFQLAGKRNPIHLYELLGREEGSPKELRNYLSEFAQAREMLLQEDWPAARARFEGLVALRPDDGPALFFLSYCRECMKRPQEKGAGRVIRFRRK